MSVVWHKVLDKDGIPAEGRVMTVHAGTRALALTHYQGVLAALDNRCPHQHGPLGEGAIEDGCLRCPWHGWDFHPTTGKSPGGFDDGVETFPVDLRDDGLYVALPGEKPHQRTVADVLAGTLAACGVSHVFGMVGHSNLGMADALRRQEEAGRLRFIGIRHEGAASFAASAYGKLTGRPAACFSIAGPGATNLLTGLYDAKVDHAPVIALTGQVDLQVLGPGAFQEVDLGAAFQAVAPFSHTVYETSRHEELVRLAVKNALVRQQVAHLVLPNEVQETPAPEGPPPAGLEGRLGREEIAPPEDALQEALAALRAAERPVIVVGHGARFHMQQVTALAEELGLPVLTTFKAKGQIADSHPLACGVLGRSGTPIASWFMNESDLMLVLGASYSNHTGITPKRATIQVDHDPLALGRFFPVQVPVLGDIGVTVARLRRELAGARKADRRGEVAERWSIWRAEKQRRLGDGRDGGLSSAAVFEAMNGCVQHDAVIAVDVGNNTYSFGRYFECSGQSVLMSGYLGSIGFGYPAAIGARAAAPGRPTWCVTGDGGFAQYMAEVTTAVRHNLDITHVLLNNNQLGKISKEQQAGQFAVWSTDLVNPDFAAYVQSCGGLGIRVMKAAGLKEALCRARDHKGPATVEILTDARLV